MKSFPKDIMEYTRLFQQGCEEGFSYFYNELYPNLFAFAYKFLGDRGAAEDEVQESFLKIWKQYQLFDQPHTIKSWLYTTVRNSCLNGLRQTGRHQAIHEILARQHTKLSEDNLLEEIYRIESAARVYRIIKSLPTECGRIYEMTYIQGKTANEIAKELDLSVSTVKNQKRRGLEILRKALLCLVCCYIILLTAISLTCKIWLQKN
jgi:RNA polymerase sigma-70 factor (family 1)